MKPLLVTSGEPAGIGPDLCLALAPLALPVVVLGDPDVLAARAKQLGYSVSFKVYQPNEIQSVKADQLIILPLTAPAAVIPGELDKKNAAYVLEMLDIAVSRCLANEFSALITAPVHKGIINESGIAFTGHTEFLAKKCQIKSAVMLLMCDAFKVALVTTHVPLRKVSDEITQEKLQAVIECIHSSLQLHFGIKNPVLYVAGLNPHAGENGYLGGEENEVIIPTLTKLRTKGIQVFGPYPADTLFSEKNRKSCDVFVTMYHDQGLPVIKFADFSRAVNVTLGLPIIRTSVDHGTALELAGKGLAEPGSLIAAVRLAHKTVKEKRANDH